jgi:hypothetical protein
MTGTTEWSGRTGVGAGMTTPGLIGGGRIGGTVARLAGPDRRSECIVAAAQLVPHDCRDAQPVVVLA